MTGLTDNRLRILSLTLWSLIWFAPSPLAIAGRSLDSAEQEIRSAIKASGADVALVFQTLDDAEAFTIGPDLEFHAASTMKVPVMIELFRQAEKGDLSLDDTLVVVNEFKSIVDGSPYRLDVGDDSDGEIYAALGQTRTLRQLCDAMITVSSNLATNLLIERLGVENIRRTVGNLGADGMNVLRGVEDGKAFRAGLSNTTTARALGILLEKIGKGHAVSASADAEMIEILKRQRFNNGIPAALPSGVEVAHKTGSITAIHHDAAIVYGPQPFVLVILTRGEEDQDKSAALMGTIAKVLFEALREAPGAP